MSGKRVSGQGLRSKNGSVSRKTNEGGVYQATKIPDSVIRVMRHKKPGIGHPAPFPVDLVTEFLIAFSDAEDLVCEPFAGAGTQLISAESIGRRCYAIEISPAY
jgi:DNA modification methylase